MPQENLDASTDEELMQAYQRGDDRAFAALYSRHSGKVYGFLLNRLKDRAFADDVFQATFMKLHKARSHYDPSFPFVPWLFTVCKSSMLDEIRKQKKIKEDIDSSTLDRAIAEEPSPSPSIPDLSSLPAAQRQAIQFRYAQDLSFEEISKRLETSPTNVRQLISRAIKKLRLKS